MTESSNNTGKSETLYLNLLNAILDSRYPPGTKLIERQLCSDFNVGRPPLRERLFQLESNGFLKYQTNKGFNVPPLSKEELRECYPVIWALEKEAMRSAFNLLTLLSVELIKINEEFKAASDVHQILALDKEFHNEVCHSSSNPTLSTIIEACKLRTKRYDFIFFKEPAFLRQSYLQHKLLIEQIINNDVEHACNTLEMNWRVGLEYLLTKL